MKKKKFRKIPVPPSRRLQLPSFSEDRPTPLGEFFKNFFFSFSNDIFMEGDRVLNADLH